jgi:hypothetical protein
MGDLSGAPACGATLSTTLDTGTLLSNFDLGGDYPEARRPLLMPASLISERPFATLVGLLLQTREHG